MQQRFTWTNSLVIYSSVHLRSRILFRTVSNDEDDPPQDAEKPLIVQSNYSSFSMIHCEKVLSEGKHRMDLEIIKSVSSNGKLSSIS
jgi:hypothetical protein